MTPGSALAACWPEDRTYPAHSGAQPSLLPRWQSPSPTRARTPLLRQTFDIRCRQLPGLPNSVSYTLADPPLSSPGLPARRFRLPAAESVATEQGSAVWRAGLVPPLSRSGGALSGECPRPAIPPRPAVGLRSARPAASCPVARRRRASSAQPGPARRHGRPGRDRAEAGIPARHDWRVAGGAAVSGAGERDGGHDAER